MSEEITKTPYYLALEEKGFSRPLYEEVFPEDSQRFVDFYYEYKTRDNEILVLKDKDTIVSMLHLNPYKMIVNGYEVQSRYIVAVATRKAYRHKGCMETLLKKALHDTASLGIPFVFLMPASEKIYAPYDFVRICSHTKLPRRIEKMDAEAQNRYLAARCQMFCKRDDRYMENLEAERQAEAGEASSEPVPSYMARVTDVCRMLSLSHSHKEQTLCLYVKDPVIEKNNGYYAWQVSPEGSRAQKLTGMPERVDLELSIGELASMLFESLGICLSEFV
ncbi:MAG TPA: hypothetical protein DD414_11795 [Lachnospiraceae bacterium]|nr:hypothetical protein [Lachnospiraceae bacterium]